MQRIITAFVVGALAMAAGGLIYFVQNGWALFGRKETIAIGEVVNGIHQLNRLVVFQAYITAQTTTHDDGWVTENSQTMLTPAFVNYYVDMDSIRRSQVRVDGKHIYVPRPIVLTERPNIDSRNVQVFSDGIWSVLSSETEKLRKLNDKMALEQLNLRAKMPFLMEAATKSAVAAEEVNIRKALAVAGHADAIVHVGTP